MMSGYHSSIIKVAACGKAVEAFVERQQQDNKAKLALGYVRCVSIFAGAEFLHDGTLRGLRNKQAIFLAGSSSGGGEQPSAFTPLFSR